MAITKSMDSAELGKHENIKTLEVDARAKDCLCDRATGTFEKWEKKYKKEEEKS